VFVVIAAEAHTESDSPTRKKVPQAQLLHEEQQRSASDFPQWKNLEQIYCPRRSSSVCAKCPKKEENNFYVTPAHFASLFLLFFDVGVFCRLRSSVYSR
jgi:hypothetical protein